MSTFSEFIYDLFSSPLFDLTSNKRRQQGLHVKLETGEKLLGTTLRQKMRPGSMASWAADVIDYLRLKHIY
jgi:hypothetical protein